MARLELEVGIDVLLLETGDALLLEEKLLVALKYIVELRDSSGNLVNILQNAHEIAFAKALNEPATLAFALPADDAKASGIILANEVWLRNYDTGAIIKKFRLNLRRDTRR